MTRSNLFLKAGFLLLIVGLAGCLLLPASQTAPAVKATAAATATPPPETDLTVIPLAGAASRAGAQISGLAWAGDHLVLLPQYPDRVTSEAGDALLALTRDEILAFLDDPGSEPLTPTEIRFDSRGIERTIAGFEGYEALAFAGLQAYLTVEARARDGMKSYLVRGELSPDGSALTLEAGRMVEAPLDVQIRNYSNEAILIDGGRVVLFYEANGAGVYPQPRAPVYDRDLNPLDSLTLDNLEYRLTDATAPDAQGRFWVSNFFFQGDLAIVTARDPLAEQFGQGASHAQAAVVERIVAMQLPRGEESHIALAGEPPIQLRLANWYIPRNWEGIARLEGRGFLLVTDEFPATILAFAPDER